MLYQSLALRYWVMEGGLATSEGIREATASWRGEVGSWKAARPREETLNCGRLISSRMWIEVSRVLGGSGLGDLRLRWERRNGHLSLQ